MGTWYLPSFFWGVHIWGQQKAPLMKILCFRLCSFILQRDIQRRARFFQYLLSTSKKLFSVVSSLMKNIILPKHNICLFYSPIHRPVIIIKLPIQCLGQCNGKWCSYIEHTGCLIPFTTLYTIISISKSNLNTLYLNSKYQNYPDFQNL